MSSGDAERILHVADARRGGGQREMRALGAMGDAAGLDDMAEQAEIGEIESHGSDPAFAFGEGRLYYNAHCDCDIQALIFV